MKKAVSNLKRLFFFTKYFGRSPLGQAFTTRFFCDEKPLKIAQTGRSILNANPIGAWSAFLLFSKKNIKTLHFFYQNFKDWAVLFVFLPNLKSKKEFFLWKLRQ